MEQRACIVKASAWSKSIVCRLLRCWNALQALLARPLAQARSVEDLGRAGRLSAYAEFILQLEEGSPRNADPVLTQALLDQQRRFQSGELFGPLLPVAASGGIIVARIIQQGAVVGDHFVAIFPSGY